MLLHIGVLKCLISIDVKEEHPSKKDSNFSAILVFKLETSIDDNLLQLLNILFIFFPFLVSKLDISIDVRELNPLKISPKSVTPEVSKLVKSNFSIDEQSLNM